MISFNLLILVSLAYVVFLFLIAFAAERRAAQPAVASRDLRLIHQGQATQAAAAAAA